MSNSLRPYGLQTLGFSVHGILQARILEWVAMPFSRESSQPRDRTHISYISCTGRRVPLPPVPPWKPIIGASKKHRKIECCKNGQELVTECEREWENWAVSQISTPDINHRLYLLSIGMSIGFLLNDLLLNTV